MGFVPLWIIAAALISGVAAYAADEPPPVPEEWREYLELNQQFNVGLHVFQNMTAEQRKPVKVYHWDLKNTDDKKISTIQCQFADLSSVQQYRFKDAEGNEYVRFFVIDQKHAPLEQFTELFGPLNKNSGAPCIQSKFARALGFY